MKREHGPSTSIVDSHCHTSYDDLSTADDLFRAARQHGIGRAVNLGDVLAFGYHPTPDQVHLINAGTARAMERHPGFFAGLCFINPEHSIAFVQAEISRCVNEWGFSGVKLEASVKATSSRLNPVMEAVHSLGVFVLHHAWYNVNGTLEAESTPADIADLASRFPDVRILMAHLGGARVRGVRDIENYPNVSVDTSGSQPTSGLVEFAVHVLGRDRVVFGSDVPGRDFSAQLGRVLGARISEEDRARILAGNAVELLKRAEVVP